MTDGGLWPLIKAHIPGDFTRIELGAVSLGVPDVNYCIDGIEGWIELKGTDTLKAGLRPPQVGWISRRTRAGGRVFIMVRRKHNGGPRRGDPVDELWLVPGSWVSQLNSAGLGVMPVWMRLGEKGPRHWDWKQVRSVLTAPLSFLETPLNQTP